MLDLPYEKILTIQQSITILENLVAVFSQKSGPRLLQVYNTDTPPPPPREEVRVITLRELADRDLTEYDGLLVGFSAMDLLREDLMTKGPLFFPIERIFQERKEIAALYRTCANLSIELMKRLREQGEQGAARARQRIEAKALWMTLPFILQERDCENLVSILPAGELNRFILKKSFRFIYNQKPRSPQPGDLDLDEFMSLALDTGSTWVVALEEAALLNPRVRADQPRFLELRGLLRASGKQDDLQVTRFELAHQLVRAQERIRSRGLLVDSSQPYLPAALKLLSEYWLAQCELEDLVAFCPHNDFNTFMQTGDAVRVYRVIEEGEATSSSGPGRVISLARLVKEGLPEGYGETIFTFPMVRVFLRHRAGINYQPLGDLIWKIGEGPTLARSLWLLAHGLLNGLCGSFPGTQAALDTLLDMALRACVLYSLSDPWIWRQGRWKVYLESCYRTPLEVLARASAELDRPLSAYYQALGCWYGCYDGIALDRKLRETLDGLREFERGMRERQRSGVDLRAYLASSRQLIEISEALLRLPVSNQTIESKNSPAEDAARRMSVTEGLCRAASFSEPLPVLSSFFKQAWENLLRFRYQRQQLYSRERDIDRLIRQLDQLRETLFKEKRRLFAPAHELNILSFAFQQEIDHVETLLRELETAAKLTVNLRNLKVDLHKEVNLTLDISNLGRVEAEGLELNLEPGRGFEPLDESPVREIQVLNPGESKSVYYHIRPVREDAELRVEYSFRDRRGQSHKDNCVMRLNVVNLDEEPYQVKVNRYQFGRPIQEPTEFYGRRSELENILAQIIAGGKQNLLLRGPRRMGKTSLLYMLQRAMTDPPTRRFFNLPMTWDSKLDHVHPIFLSLHSFDLQSGGVAVSQFFRTVLERVSRALGYPEDHLAVVLAVYERRESDVGAVNAALEQAGRILDCYPTERIVVLLDEYDEVYRPETGTLDRHLREFVSAEQRLTWIIASTLALFREVKTISSPWFNVFSIIELSRLSEDAAISLVENPCKDERVFWRSDAVLTLLAETGRHPAFTQLFCAKVIARLNQMRTNYVLEDTILTLADEIVDEQETANSHFEFYWLDTSGIGQLILLILDDYEMPLKRDELRRWVRSRLALRFGDLPNRRVRDPSGDPIEWAELQFKTGIDFVEKIVNAVSLDDQRRYQFTVPLFRRWLRRRRRFEDLMAETYGKISQEMEHDGLALH